MILLHIFVIFLMVANSYCYDYTLPPKLKDIKFDQSILAVGVPFYKLLMSLGKCNKTLLYEEQRAWGKVKFNRVMDIYYKSGNPEFLVSRVEIVAVLDNADCSVYSKDGVGRAEFAATMFIPTRVSMIFYSLKIWTCSEASSDDGRQFELSFDSREMIEEKEINKKPIYSRPIRPDAPPHNIVYNSTPFMFIHPNEFDEIEFKEATKSKAPTQLPLSFANV